MNDGELGFLAIGLLFVGSTVLWVGFPRYRSHPAAGSAIAITMVSTGAILALVLFAALVFQIMGMSD